MKKVIIFLFSIVCLVSQAQDTINKTDANGQKHGYWLKKDSAGKKIYEGHFANGKPEGTFRYYYPGGSVKAVSVFSGNGTKTHTITYFVNGRKMSEGNYLNEKKDSLWRFYSEYDTSLVGEENYSEGVLDGISRTFYPGDGLSEIVTWKNGIKHGLWEQYYQEGKVKLRGHFLNGEKEGEFKTFYSTGEILFEGQYKKGMPEGVWIYYDEKGTVEKKETYLDGYRINKWELHPEVEEKDSAQ